MERSAAEALLGEHEWRLAAVFDEIYYHDIVDQWRERHHRAQEHRARIEHLQQRRSNGPIERDELIELACLLIDIHDVRTDLQLLRDAAAVEPDHPKIAFWLGAALLETGDQQGLDQLEHAMRLDPRSAVAACRSSIEYLDTHGRRTDAQHCRERMDQRVAVEIDAEREREQLHPDMQLAPHQLADHMLEALRDHAARAPDLMQLHIWRRPTEHLPNEPVYLLGISFDDERYDDLTDAEVHPVDKVMSKLMPVLDQHMIDAMPVPLNDDVLSWIRDKRDEASLIFAASHVGAHTTPAEQAVTT